MSMDKVWCLKRVWHALGICYKYKGYTVTCQINVHNVGNSIDFNVFSCSQEKKLFRLSLSTYSHAFGVIQKVNNKSNKQDFLMEFRHCTFHMQPFKIL